MAATTIPDITLRPQDVPHHRHALLRWWSQPGEWQHQFAMQGRHKIEGWIEDQAKEAEEARWWMASTFQMADLYWVSPEMTEVIEKMAPSIPDCTPQPPVPDGFVIFAKSIPGTDSANGESIFTTAFLWGTITMYKVGKCVALESYAWRDLVHAVDGLSPKLQKRFREIYPNPLMPTGGSEWPLDEMLSDFSRIPPDNLTAQESILEDRKLLATFWALCSQKIAIETVERPGGRAAMRQAQREGRKLDEVRVIRLREPAARATNQGSLVEWSHRWVVGSHWRNQWYPSAGEHRPKLIDSYVKGPAEKPLVVRETVRALVR